MATPPTPISPSKPDPAREDQRARLLALRDRLEAAVAGAGPRDLAPLAGQLRRVLADLAAVPDTGAESKVDDLAAKRAARRAASAG